MVDAWFFDVLPYRPAPYSGECLSGYLLRLAQANGVDNFWDLISDLFPTWRKTRQISRLRWEYPLDEWGRIPLRTQFPLAVLSSLTVAPWIEKFRVLPVVSTPSTQSAGRFLHGVVRPHLQVCPLCLQAQPYLRLMWRLAPVRVCLEHGCLLQRQCYNCGASLTAVSESQRHLHCAACDADLRLLPVEVASTDVLAECQRRQADFRFLLDPGVTLVNLPNLEAGYTITDLPQAIGLKFRYLRSRMGQSVVEMARRVGVTAQALSLLERGQRAPLALYLTYLETLSWSWEDFADLKIPSEFIRDLQEPPYLALRICPTPECPNHQSPPSIRVNILANIPERRKVRFRCMSCGRRFTRTYDGELVSKPRRPPIRPGEHPRIVKPAEEIARLREMGLQGRDNREIAGRLGWGERTVRTYWIALGLEKQVHRAQARRRIKKQQQRRAALHASVEAVLETLLDRDEEITLRKVGQALGYNPDYLHSYPDLAAQVQDVLRRHNAQVKRRRYEALLTQITRSIEALKHSNDAVTVRAIAQQASLSYEKLREVYPELHAMVRETVRDHQARIKVVQTETQIAQINEAAARLVAQGTCLTYGTILKEAGLSEYSNKSPVIRDVLQRWTGNFAPRD